MKKLSRRIWCLTLSVLICMGMVFSVSALVPLDASGSKETTYYGTLYGTLSETTDGISMTVRVTSNNYNGRPVLIYTVTDGVDTVLVDQRELMGTAGTLSLSKNIIFPLFEEEPKYVGSTHEIRGGTQKGEYIYLEINVS